MRWIRSVILSSITLILLLIDSSFSFKLLLSYGRVDIRLPSEHKINTLTKSQVVVKLFNSSVILVCSSEMTLTDCPKDAASVCNVCNALSLVNKAGVKFKSGSTFSRVANSLLIYKTCQTSVYFFFSCHQRYLPLPHYHCHPY